MLTPCKQGGEHGLWVEDRSLHHQLGHGFDDFLDSFLIALDECRIGFGLLVPSVQPTIGLGEIIRGSFTTHAFRQHLYLISHPSFQLGFWGFQTGDEFTLNE